MTSIMTPFATLVNMFSEKFPIYFIFRHYRSTYESLNFYSPLAFSSKTVRLVFSFFQFS